MKCTDFQIQLKEIVRAEKAELRKAIAAHGGMYAFYDEPEILCGTKPVKISSIAIDNEYLLIYCADGSLKKYQKIEPENFFPGQLSQITGLIPETKTVKSVETKIEKIITLAELSREEIRNAGYSSENVTDELLDEMAEDLWSWCWTEDLSGAIDQVCDKYNLKQI